MSWTVRSDSARRGWHRADWGPLGLVETLLKGTAFLIAYAALARSLGSSWAAPTGVHRIQAVIVALAELGLATAIIDRVLEREITAFVFILFNNAAHIALLLALCTTHGADWAVAPFAALMVCGELVKIRFLRTTGFTVRDHPNRLLVGLTCVAAAIYAVLLAVTVIA